MKATGTPTAWAYGSKTPNLCLRIARRPLIILVIVMAVLIVRSAPIHAHPHDGEPRALSLLKFGTGIISAYALHETGHVVAAALTDTDLDWGIGTYNQPLGFTERAKSDGAGMLVHASGLSTQIITSEIILQSDSIDKNDSNVRGKMFGTSSTRLSIPWIIGCLKEPTGRRTAIARAT